MRHFSIHLLILLVLVACQSTAPEVKVISYSSDELSDRFDGAAILASDRSVNLKGGEDFLVLSEDRDQVYQIVGPVQGQLSDLMQSADTRTFARGYFSFIIDNLDRSSADAQTTVYGGVSRGESIWKYREGEALITDVPVVDTSFIIYSTDFIMTADGQPVDQSVIGNLADLRKSNKDIAISLQVDTHVGKKSRELVLKSKESVSQIIAGAEKLRESDAPSIALASYYLEHQLYSEFADLMQQLENTPTALERFQ